VLWLLHQFRQAYDFWGTPHQDLPDTPEGRQVRKVVIESDNRFLPEHHKIYTNSHVTGDRLRRFNGIESEVLFPPLLYTSGFFCRGYGDTIFYPSRIASGKRQYLVVEAMKHVKTPVKLVIAGGPETPAELAKLETVIEQHQLHDRVTITPRFISEDEKCRLFADALACAYIPYDEDSYGYVTLEAFQSRKPVITCSDSGGTLILVKDGVSGLVVPPDPVSLALAMDRLYADRLVARRLGEQGFEMMLELGITWEHVVECLTA
jgi:glycosyltransferase involved in cell wall biosynthesis